MEIMEIESTKYTACSIKREPLRLEIPSLIKGRRKKVETIRHWLIGEVTITYDADKKTINQYEVKKLYEDAICKWFFGQNYYNNFCKWLFGKTEGAFGKPDYGKKII